MRAMCVVTGGSSGIGLELCRALARRGDSVFSIDLAPCPDTSVVSLVADVRSAVQLEEQAARVPSPVDVLVSNAGIMRRGDLLAAADADIDLLLDVHVKGALRVFRALHGKLREDAVFLQMSSRHARTPPADPGIYGLSKQACAHVAGLIHRTCPRLRVKLAFPGPVDTPLARYGVTGAALEQKEKVMHAPAHLAALLLQLIDTPAHLCLDFDEPAWDYVFEDVYPQLPL